MLHRTALCLSLDEDQKKALLSHSIWTIDNLSDDSLESLAKQIEISKPIIEKSPIPIRMEKINEYRCGIDSVDNHLSSIIGGCITEISGLPGSGRTTLCLRYAKEVQPGITLWIDTEGCLYPPKGLQLAVIRIHDHLQFFALTHKIADIVEAIKPSLIVVDSIAATMRGEASTDAGRTSLLWEFAIMLKKIAAQIGIPVLITNHLSKLQFQSFVSTLGPSWQNVCTHSFEIKNLSDGRILRVIKSPCLPRIDIQMTYNEGEIGKIM